MSLKKRMADWKFLPNEHFGRIYHQADRDDIADRRGCAGGVARLPQLSVAALPTVEFPTIEVHTSYPGASPDVMQSSVSAPLEYYMGRIPGLVVMTSASSYGTSLITLQFSLNRDIASAAQDVQEAIQRRHRLATGGALPTPPVYRKVNPADMPVIVWRSPPRSCHSMP